MAQHVQSVNQCSPQKVLLIPACDRASAGLSEGSSKQQGASASAARSHGMHAVATLQSSWGS